MNKILKYIMIISGLGVIICPVLYNIIGSKVLEDGTLDEPFYLVGFMWMFLIILIITLILFLITNKKNKI